MDFGTSISVRGFVNNVLAECGRARYRLGDAKGDIPRGSLPVIISEFVCEPDQETKPIEMLYGEVHGDARNDAVPFFELPRRDNPELYAVAFVAGTWRRPNVDFCDCMYGGFRRLLPLLGDTADRDDLRRVATGERQNSGKPDWSFPETWRCGGNADIKREQWLPFGIRIQWLRYGN